MSKEYPCVYFEEDDVCRKFSDDTNLSYCVMGPCPEQTLSNADRIRAMSNEELADFLNRCTAGEDAPAFCRKLPECDADLETDTLIPLERCGKCLLHWLRQPAKEGMS